MFERKKTVTFSVDPTQSNGMVVLAAGIDAGSTETRVALADYRDVEVFNNTSTADKAYERLSKTYIIPSTFAVLNDARELLPVSPSLEDNYDSTIILVSNGAEKPMLSKNRILRGRKMQDTPGAVYRYLDSSTNKSDNVIFYTNVVDALGYSILSRYSGCIPKDVRVHLVLSVRPKELSTICRNKMTENLVGTYMFVWGDVKITINIASIDYTTEPEAQVFGLMTVNDLCTQSGIPLENKDKIAALCNSDSFVHIEGGGSSIGVEVLRDGEILASCSSTFELGGNYMSQIFIDRIRETYGRTITRDSANQALITCMLRNGNSRIDVSDIVADVKNTMAQAMVERLRHSVIDISSEITLYDIQYISLSGRLFRPDEGGNTISY